MTGPLATILIALIIAVAHLTPAECFAQTTGQNEQELTRARELFQEALSLEVAGDFAAALGKLQQVAKVRLTPQVRYHLARCKENLGRFTEALGDYRVAATEARDAGLAELEEFERARAAIEARVPRLRVNLRAANSSASVELDGVRVGTAVLLAPLPVDPGLRRLVLRDGDRVLQTQTVMAIEGQTTEVVLDGGVQTQSASVATVEDPGRRDSAPAWAYVAGAMGVVGAASSVALWVVRNEAINDLKSDCYENVCPERLRSTVNRGRFASWASPIAGTAGALGLGFAVWGFWPQKKVDKRTGLAGHALHLSVNAGPQFGGVQLSREF